MKRIAVVTALLMVASLAAALPSQNGVRIFVHNASDQDLHVCVVDSSDCWMLAAGDETSFDANPRRAEKYADDFVATHEVHLCGRTLPLSTLLSSYDDENRTYDKGAWNISISAEAVAAACDDSPAY